MRRWISWILSFILMLLPCALSESAPVQPREKNASLRLLDSLYDGQNTLVYSPLSLANALSMAAEGAVGDTRAQLDSFLGNTPEWELFKEDMAFSGVAMEGIALLNSDLLIRENYEETLSDVYDAPVAPMVPGGVMAQVNDWVSDATDGLILEMLSSEPDSRTMLLLLSALTMKAEWASPFSPAQTAFTVFHAPDGEIEVSTMRQTGTFAYGNTDGVQAISLPYRNSFLQMTVLMPENGDLSALIDALCASPDEFLRKHLPSEEVMVRLSLPNVRAESSFELKDALIAAGVSDAFDPDQADFTAMAENAFDLKLHISSVLQKAVLKVNESGTEAAAVTQVSKSEGCAAPLQEPVEMNVDRPFLMLVNDPGSGYVLFAACINNPA